MSSDSTKSSIYIKMRSNLLVNLFNGYQEVKDKHYFLDNNRLALLEHSENCYKNQMHKGLWHNLNKDQGTQPSRKGEQGKKLSLSKEESALAKWGDFENTQRERQKMA